MRWKVYYGDGSTFSSSDGPPQSAPKLNTQIVAQADMRCGRVLISSHSYYWWEPSLNQWMGGNDNGLWDYLMREVGIVLFARSMRTLDFEKLYERAVADTDLPLKSATNYALEERK